MSVETRPVPVNILRWPKTRDLITQHKFIYVTLYCNADATSCGCYLVGIESLAADMSMTASSLEDALNEFKRRGLIEYDRETGEVFVLDWPRWHNYKTLPALGALQSSIEKIQSRKLWITVKKAYESTLQSWKGKDKAKVKASSIEEEPVLPSRPQYKPCYSEHGVRIWTEEDKQQCAVLEAKYDGKEIQRAVQQLHENGKEPLPSRISKLLNMHPEDILLPQNWWLSIDGTNDAGKVLGLAANTGEHLSAFQHRIRMELDRLQASKIHFA